jgi:hypothetical protein
MKRYEYKYVDSEYLYQEARMTYLNQMGAEGWRMIDMKHGLGSIEGGLTTVYLFEREITT